MTRTERRARTALTSAAALSSSGFVGCISHHLLELPDLLASLGFGRLAGQLLGQSAVAVDSDLVQRSGLHGRPHFAAGFGVVFAAPEAALVGQVHDVLEGVVERLGGVPEADLADAGRV